MMRSICVLQAQTKHTTHGVINTNFSQIKIKFRSSLKSSSEIMFKMVVFVSLSP